MAVVMNLLAKPGALRTREEARAILKDVTPLKKNCGRLCDAACCQSDESGENGMLLFPFEECLYDKPIEGFPFHLVDDDTLRLIIDAALLCRYGQAALFIGEGARR